MSLNKKQYHLILSKSKQEYVYVTLTILRS